MFHNLNNIAFIFGYSNVSFDDLVALLLTTLLVTKNIDFGLFFGEVFEFDSDELGPHDDQVNGIQKAVFTFFFI